ncbi:MAG: SPFH domain-containing protein [Planctomycetota bacterium]
MGLTSIVIGLIIAAAILSLIPKVTNPGLRGAIALGALLAIVISVVFSSIRYVSPNQVGIVKKNALGSKLTGGRIIATDGEMGIQADVLSPGWQTGYWPVIFDVDTVPLVEVPAGSVGLVEARDGEPLDPGQLYAPEVDTAEFKKMIEDPRYFLENGGRKGPQSNVLTPGKYRVNTELFNIEMVPATDVMNATVAVLKANFGAAPTLQRAADDGETITLAGPGEKGVRADPLPPGTYPINPNAFEVTTISTRETILRFTAAQGVLNQSQGASRLNVAVEEREITVRTSDGFTFPVDVRIEYKIEPANAPIVVAKLGSDGQALLSKMNSAVRAIFRNNAENVKALDYVNQRSIQESQSLAMLQEAMSELGVSILAVRIGDVGNEDTLGELLQTQRDREIAVQEQVTFQEQQRAAEQKKALTRTEQEAEEERRLATAQYEVQIAEQAKEQQIIAAQAEAEAIQIRAAAQADAFRLVAEQIGAGNAALMEILSIVGERAIEITPRVMVTGGGSGSPGDAETTALIGTMLDSMVSRDAPRSNQGGSNE